MKRLIVAVTLAVASSIAVAVSTPPPGGPFVNTGIDAKTYLLDKNVDYSVARSLPYRFPYWVTFENVIADNDRLLVLMGWKSGKGAKFEPVAIRKLTTVLIPRVDAGAIVIDGNDDYAWASILPAVSDPTGDRTGTTSGTDLVSVKLARDDTHMYARIGLGDGQPNGAVMYVFELMQYDLQQNTPGDVLVNCAQHGWNPSSPPPPWSCLVHDRNQAFRGQYMASDGYFAAGNGFLEWKIPLNALQNQASMTFPMFPPDRNKVDKGIDNRFIHVYTHPSYPPGTPPADNMEPAGQPWERPLIIRFWE